MLENAFRSLISGPDRVGALIALWICVWTFGTLSIALLMLWGSDRSRDSFAPPADDHIFGRYLDPVFVPSVGIVFGLLVQHSASD